MAREMVGISMRRDMSVVMVDRVLWWFCGGFVVVLWLVLLVAGSRGCFDQFGGEFWVLEIIVRW